MANKKISQLTELQGQSIDSNNDVIAIVDSSGTETKKVTIEELISANTGSTDKNYVHNQIASSATWVVTHNLSKFPSVTVVDSAGTQVSGTVVHDSINQTTITFISNGVPSPFSGKAFFN